MKFIKKSLVLKEVEKGYSVSDKPLSGIARLETECGVSEFYLTVINSLPVSDAEYFACLYNSVDKMLLLSLGKRPASFRSPIENYDCTKPIAIGLAVIKDDIPITVAFAKEPNCNLSLSDFKRALAEKCLQDRKTRHKETPPIEPIKEPEQVEKIQEPKEDFNAPEEVEVYEKYNDEAVATENYFDFDETQEKLNAIKEYDFVRLQPKNELPTDKSQEKAKQSPKIFDSFQDEKNTDFGEKLKEEQPFFLSVSAELTSILNKFPPEEGLNKLFPDGKFVKINYSADKFYVVGLIKENGKEKYVCYGVPAVYSPTPPKELAGYCSFIPLSIFDLNGDGYWMMFQDALTGKCINASPIE